MWFFLTCKACKKRSWLSLFYDFLLCHCEWGIHICQTWKYLHAIDILQFFPAHVSANVAWHQISSQLYHLRICGHDYHCLCFMIFLFWAIFICFHGYCFLHFGCSCREFRVATLVQKVLAVRLRFYNCVSPRRFPFKIRILHHSICRFSIFAPKRKTKPLELGRKTWKPPRSNHAANKFSRVIEHIYLKPMPPTTSSSQVNPLGS